MRLLKISDKLKLIPNITIPESLQTLIDNILLNPPEKQTKNNNLVSEISYQNLKFLCESGEFNLRFNKNKLHCNLCNNLHNSYEDILKCYDNNTTNIKSLQENIIYNPLAHTKSIKTTISICTNLTSMSS